MKITTCSVEECTKRRYKTYRMCSMHQARWKRHGDVTIGYSLTVEDAFFERVLKTETCWLWQNKPAGNGYGSFRFKNVRYSAHRFAYELLVGPIPQGLHIDHLCRVRHCVNPSHLEAVTKRVNTLRGTGPTAQRARQTHCKRGHPLSGANLKVGDNTGYRICRQCSKMTKSQRQKETE